MSNFNEFVDAMVSLGYPPQDFGRLSSNKGGAQVGTIKSRWYDFTLQSDVEKYMKKNKINPTKLTFSELMELAYSYVEENTPVQFSDEDGDGRYDETYDIWNSAFRFSTEWEYSYLFDNNHRQFIRNVNKNKKRM